MEEKNTENEAQKESAIPETPELEENSGNSQFKRIFQKVKSNSVAVILGAVLLFVALFIIQNLNSVSVRFLWMEFRMVLSLALIFALALGYVIGVFWTRIKDLILSRRNKA